MCLKMSEDRVSQDRVLCQISIQITSEKGHNFCERTKKEILMPCMWPVGLMDKASAPGARDSQRFLTALGCLELLSAGRSQARGTQAPWSLKGRPKLRNKPKEFELKPTWHRISFPVATSGATSWKVGGVSSQRLHWECSGVYMNHKICPCQKAASHHTYRHLLFLNIL